MQLLAARPHFRRELQVKLVQRDFPEDEIESALDRLTAQGLLDDPKTAAAFVAHRQERRGEGRHRLRAELQRRGAGPEAIDQALAQLPDDDLDQAREAAGQWSRRRAGSEGLESDKNRAALARHLERRGFSRRAIVAVLNAAGAEPEEDA
ncbi:MAG TPA: regulatory protein RecX [Thermoanaerobaculia bacterium]|nr:regulatory protein RecX [Thermoanaerobaculia bacterium]